MASAVTWQSYPPETLLRERFHITTGFHPGQRDIIEQLLQSKRLLVIQRTGWGKSLCYQMASLYFPHLTIVFSPLKALMRDQCQRCNDIYNIPAAIVSSDFSPEENRATLAQAIEGHCKILFIAPERLDNAVWQTYVLKMRISMVVIDEAHCISTWGHDFRPQYRRIASMLTALPRHMPVLALTATANKRVEQDILEQLGAGVQVIRGSMQRPNLYLNVVTLQGDREKLAYLGEMLPRCPGTGVIYTATKHDAEMVAALLNSQGIVSEYYHAGREDAVRQDIEKKWMANQYRVVCSTNALGMGIDKHDLRFVIHYHMPASPIHYYQEMGRAGRDGKVAWCILLYDPRDLDIQNYAQKAECYMEYLTTYLGDQPGYSCRSCGQCRASNFPVVRSSKRMQEAVVYYLEEALLPHIERRGGKSPAHEAGWSLAYHGISRVGKLVRVSKYEDAGPFALSLVTRAVEIIRNRYPIEAINGIVSVPPTRSGMLVESFARQVAAQLGVEYLAALKKVRITQEQKSLKNWLQKADNVKGAFAVRSPEQIAGRVLLLIDDIYDSGYMMREVAQTLMRAGAKIVYPFTITRTAHSDDQ